MIPPFLFHRWFLAVVLPALWILSTCQATSPNWPAPQVYDVVIVGGSTAAFAAALSAADTGAATALLEPTDWVGGQLTASGVPAVDECWHRVTDPKTKQVVCDASRIARDPRNMNARFLGMLLRTGNPGRGWVSRFCFDPRHFLVQELLPQEFHRTHHLTVFRETVIKRVRCEGDRIVAIDAVRRVPRPQVPWQGYDRLPSEELADWYDPKPSARFHKELLSFGGERAVFIDASEWGELLVLSGADFLQGIDLDDGTPVNESCGQCITYGLVQEILAEPASTSDRSFDVEQLGFGSYANRPDRWQQVWTYRRLRAAQEAPSVGDLSLQNWGYFPELREGGNDYPFRYLFLTRNEARATQSDWQGGIDVQALSGAEQRALAWHEWFRDQAPPEFHPDQIALARGVLGTKHGLSKLPYIRDTRRSIGLDGFLLRYADLTGPLGQQTGTVFPDRVALGCYAADIHAMAGCEYPPELMHPPQPLPFCLPFRALTNRRFGNLLVAGKTMAQTFLANSATRLHPIEWCTGTAAGVAASAMAQRDEDSRESWQRIGQLQEEIARWTPIDWVLETE